MNEHTRDRYSKGEGMKTNRYLEVLKQVEYPDRITSTLLVRCTAAQAKESIGKLYFENPAWFIYDMILLEADT